MNCPECAQANASTLPRYGVPTARELARATERGIPFTIKPGEHCQTCLRARLNYLTY